MSPCSHVIWESDSSRLCWLHIDPQGEFVLRECHRAPRNPKPNPNRNFNPNLDKDAGCPVKCELMKYQIIF